MAVLKCKMCGGDIIAAEGQTYGVCDSCGSTVTLPNINDQRMENLFNRANYFRMVSEFDKAVATYEMILNEDNSNAEAHWGLLLSRHGIEYVEDPVSHERIPTCHRIQNDSVLSDGDYLAALEFAPDTYTRSLYEAEGKRLSELQRGLLQVSAQTEPFDVFICYKESTDGGSRTKDSTLAQDIYYQLTNEGYKVFFSRITLENILGQQYEPYIFAALNSAKVMLAIGTKPEHFSAVWVKNEWSRFLALMKQDRTKLLIPCYRDMNVYDLPDELSMLQSQDMSKIGFMQDLLRGIEKVLLRQKEPTGNIVRETVSYGENRSIAPLLKRAFMFLEDGDWQNADAYCEKVLDADPENGEAYLGKMMAKLKIQKRDLLAVQAKPFDNEPLFQKAMRYGDEKLKRELDEAIRSVQKIMCEQLQSFQMKYLRKRYLVERGNYNKVKVKNDEIIGNNDIINEKITKLDIELRKQKAIFAENEKKFLGAAARAKKKAAAEIDRLETEISIAKWKIKSVSKLPKKPTLDVKKITSIDDYIKFGVYPQTTRVNDVAPIEWKVITRKNNAVLLLSRYGLEAKPYNAQFVETTWRDCSLRKWLNKDFINSAFTNEEQSAILLTNVDNSSSQGYSECEWSTNGGNNTQDKIFLLSYAEANEYLGVTYGGKDNIKSRVAPTAYAIARGAWASVYKTADGEAAGQWWLRSPGGNQLNASIVYRDGSLLLDTVDHDHICIRPALWVNLEV